MTFEGLRKFLLNLPTLHTLLYYKELYRLEDTFGTVAVYQLAHNHEWIEIKIFPHYKQVVDIELLHVASSKLRATSCTLHVNNEIRLEWR